MLYFKLVKKLSWYRSIVGKPMGDTDVSVLTVVQDLPEDKTKRILKNN